ncbi:hypothetical protein Hypma_008931 [Hypsizygus marmoreus]|uniref:Secreted protein n=1 Tax=Hypsizygus marmoreus TaxID=39966 RepID=A0A369JQB8_HYPMA|nr:hypothetical protein Hypma_008931 [Hypsizygus marmoreus]
MHTMQLILVALPHLLVSALGPINIKQYSVCPAGYTEHSRGPVRGDESLRIVLNCIETSDSRGSSGMARRAEGHNYNHHARGICTGLMCHPVRPDD